MRQCRLLQVVVTDVSKELFPSIVTVVQEKSLLGLPWVRRKQAVLKNLCTQTLPKTKCWYCANCTTVVWRIYHLQPVSFSACYGREKFVKRKFQLSHCSETATSKLRFPFVVTHCQQWVNINVCFSVWENIYKTQQMLGTVCLTLRRLMPYIYEAPILDVSRSHTTTQHSR